MIRLIKILIVPILFAVSFIPFSMSLNADAILIPEGGIQTDVQYCDEGVLVYNLDYVTNSVVPIAYIPGVSTLYSNFGVYKPGAYNVSQYIPSSFECTLDGEVVGVGYGIWYHLGTS